MGFQPARHGVQSTGTESREFESADTTLLMLSMGSDDANENPRRHINCSYFQLSGVREAVKSVAEHWQSWEKIVGSQRISDSEAAGLKEGLRAAPIFAQAIGWGDHMLTPASMSAQSAVT